jgi:glycosyltransferase involved in cell wall biosynthesis
VVLDGRTGLLVPARDPSALAAPILRLVQDPEEGRRMGREGRERVEHHFDVRRMVAEYEEIYLEYAGRLKPTTRPQNDRLRPETAGSSPSGKSPEPPV